jgi:hypothetical protein
VALADNRMKSVIPDPQQLDELAAGLDAGWDEPVEASPSQPPFSAPPPASLEALDADWDSHEATPAPPADPSPGSSRNAVRPGTIAAPPSAAPLRASKRERRDAERKRLAHQAQQKSVSKQQRKAERQAQARSSREQQIAAAEQAAAERRARQAASAPRKRAKPAATSTEVNAEPAKAPAKSRKREAKRTQREPVAAARLESKPARKSATAIPEAGGGTTKLIIVALAIVFALTMWFALSRAR